MPFRFRKSISLGKGLRVNLGKRGASLSLGGRGATVNLSGRGTRTTVGIPGTGLSYSTSDSNSNDLNKTSPPGGTGLEWLSLFTQGIGLIFSIISLLVGCVLVGFLLYFLLSP